MPLCWRGKQFPPELNIEAWQQSLDNPEEVPVRETFLFTCDLEGKNRKSVTSRKYEQPKNVQGGAGISYFFSIVEWH